MLTLPIKQPWYGMIFRGEKSEEYRLRTPYWEKRLESVFGCSIQEAVDNCVLAQVRFRNGYRADSPSFTAQVRLRIGTGRPEWGAQPGIEYFILRILTMSTEKGGQ